MLVVLARFHFGRETDARALRALLDHLVEAGKRTTADEQDAGRVDLQEFLLRMLAATLRWHRSDRAFDQLQQRLLHAFTGHVPGDARVLALARDLVDLVDVDNAALRFFALR